MVVKSVAGFMNAHGGTLLIGVTDRGEVFGFEKDLKTLGSKQNRDGFELWLTGLLDNTLGPTATSQVSISYEDFPEGTVCRIDVGPGEKPTFVRRQGGCGPLRETQQFDAAAQYRRCGRVHRFALAIAAAGGTELLWNLKG